MSSGATYALLSVNTSQGFGVHCLPAGGVFYYLKSLIESIKQQFDSILSQVKDEVMAKRWL